MGSWQISRETVKSTPSAALLHCSTPRDPQILPTSRCCKLRGRSGDAGSSSVVRFIIANELRAASSAALYSEAVSREVFSHASSWD